METMVSTKSASGQSLLFLSRVAGFPLPLLIVSKLGIGAENNIFFVQLAMATAAGSIVGSLTEIQSIAHLRGASGNSNHLTMESVRLGLLASLAYLVITFAVYRTRTFEYQFTFWLAFMPLGNSIQGSTIAKYITKDKWLLPAFFNIARPLVAASLIFSFANSANSTAVCLAIGELPRVFGGLVTRKKENAQPTHPRQSFRKSVLKQSQGSILSAANPVLDRVIVERLNFGSVALLDLSEKSAAMATYVVTLGLIPTMYPKLATELSCTTLKRFSRIILWTSLSLSLVTVSLGYLVVHTTKLISPSNSDTWLLLVCCYLLGSPGYALSQIRVRVLVLKQKLNQIILLSATLLVVNVIGDLFLGHYFNLVGIAIASACTGWVGFFISNSIVKQSLKQDSEVA